MALIGTVVLAYFQISGGNILFGTLQVGVACAVHCGDHVCRSIGMPNNQLPCPTFTCNCHFPNNQLPYPTLPYPTLLPPIIIIIIKRRSGINPIPPTVIDRD